MRRRRPPATRSTAARDLAADADRVIEQCIDKPGDKMLAVFERVRAK
jgi:hypothetical protein